MHAFYQQKCRSFKKHEVNYLKKLMKATFKGEIYICLNMKAQLTFRIIALLSIISMIVGLVSISLALVVYFQERISTVPMDPLWASVLVTIVLVGINAYYAWQTRQTIGEMEKARKAEFMPHIKASLIFLGPVYLTLKLTNVGKGPAMNVDARIVFLPSKETRPWEQRIISPNEFMHILLPDGNIKRVCRKSAQIELRGTYNDIFGQSFEIKEVIDTNEFIEKSKELKPFLEPDFPPLLKQIKDELGKIRSAIERRR